MRPGKCVVIYENDTGYMDCIAICDTAAEAYGEAYLALSDGLDAGEYYMTVPENREGDNGYIIECREKKTEKIYAWATVLFYMESGTHEINNL